MCPLDNVAKNFTKNFIYEKVEVIMQNGEITDINILEHRHGIYGLPCELKTEKPSCKEKHSVEKPVEKQAVFENLCEAAIDRETWEPLSANARLVRQSSG